MTSGQTQQRVARVLDAAIERARAAHRAPLAADVARLSRLFTTDRARRDQGYLRDPALRRAYLGFFAPQNAAKIGLLLSDLLDEGAVPAWQRPAVLDLGAGPLSGTLGAAIAFGALGPSTAVDLAERAMEDGLALFRAAFGPEPPIRLVAASLGGPPARWRPAAPVDLVVAANVLNELGDPRRGLEERVDVVRAALASLRPGGRLLIVEPGTRVHGRALMSLRDAILRDGVAAVLAPCRTPDGCPLLRSEGGWCHQELSWARSPAFERLEREAGIPKDVLKMSHLLLARPDEGAARPSGARLVGGVMRDQAGVERRYACAPQGLVTIQGRPRLPREISQARRGALLADVPPDARPERREPAPARRPRGDKPPRRR